MVIWHGDWRGFWVAVGCVALSAGSALADESAGRYVAWLADGSRVAGDELVDWHRTDGVPKLQGTALLDPARPLVALIDRWLPTGARPQAFVELANGDCLPGRVIGFRSGNEAVFEPLPAQLLVEIPDAEGSVLLPPGRPLRVLADWVRRIVWRRSSERPDFEPRTVFLRDGGRLRYRAARFAGEGVSLLLDDGTRAVRFDEIAEMHLEQPDAWARLIDELVAVAPTGSSRLMQLEAIDGLVVTASLERFRARTRTAPTLADQWEHGLQPAWSLDLIWVRCGAVRVRRMFAPSEVPLSRLFPTSRHESLLGGALWPYRVNRNVRGGPLRMAGGEPGWGFGVQAVSELRFDLHPLASHFQTRIGLDRVVGNGGCIQARVYQTRPDGSPQGADFRTPLLIGSAVEVDSGRLALAGAGDEPRGELVLEVNAAHDERPEGADPLDIRDTADWGFSTLFLDPARLADTLARRQIDRIVAWPGWQIDGAASIQRGNGYVETMGGDDRFEPVIAAVEQPLVLAQQRSLTPDDEWLVLNASHLPGRGPAPKAIVRIDGEVVAEQPFPVWQNSPFDRRPIAIALSDHRPQGAAAGNSSPVKIEVEQSAEAGAAPVVWHGLTITRQHPSLHRVYEESGGDLADAAAMGRWLATDDSFAGERSLRLAPGESIDLLLPRPLLIRERPKPGECRFLRFAVRCGDPESDIRVTILDSDPAGTPATYVAGPHEPREPLAKRLATTPWGPGWVEFTRDLYGDFGARRIIGLRLTGTGSEPLRFDSFYLARVQSDLSLATPRKPQN